MSDEGATARGNGMSSDTFDVLGTEIAALLRSTHEISARTRREADEEAKARIADATVQANARLAEAEQQTQDQLAAANERLAQADARLAAADARLAEANREAEARLAAANEQAVEIARREEAAAVLLGLVTELAARLEKRAKRSAAESQATIDELDALKAAMPAAAVASAAAAVDVDEVIDLRDPPPVEDAVEPLPKRKVKGKHKRRRKNGTDSGTVLTRSRSTGS